MLLEFLREGFIRSNVLRKVWIKIGILRGIWGGKGKLKNFFGRGIYVDIFGIIYFGFGVSFFML